MHKNLSDKFLSGNLSDKFYQEICPCQVVYSKFHPVFDYLFFMSDKNLYINYGD